MAKIQLELGGKYTAGEAFQKASDDVKKFGKENKDAIKAGTDTLKELEKGFGSDLGGAVGKAQGVISGLASGGLWGALSAVAGIAIGAVVDWFKQAEENAKQLAKTCGDYVTNSLKQLGEKFKEATGDIAHAKEEIKDLAAIAQGKITEAANAKVHKLHIETLQKITDTMTDAAKKVIQADEAVAAARIKQAAAVEIAQVKEDEQNKVIQNAKEKVWEAESQRNAILAEQNNLSKHEQEVVKRYAQLKAEEEDIIRRYKDNMLTVNHAAELQADVQKDLNELLEKNKGTIDAHSAAVEAAKEAETQVKDAIRAREHEERQLTLVQQQNAEALRQAEKAVLDATQAKKDATKAERDYLEKRKKEEEEEAKRKKKKAEAEQAEIDASNRAKEAFEAQAAAQELYEKLMQEDIGIRKRAQKLQVDENYFVEKWNQLRASGLSVEEATIELNREYKEYKKAETKITKICQELKVDEKDYLKKFLTLMESGITESEAYAELQKQLNEELKKRKEAEEKATKASEEAAEGKGGLGNNSSASASVSVSLGNGETDEIADKVEKKQGFKNEQRRLRQEMRRARDAKNNTKIDQAKMTKALKGQMPKAEAEAWMNYAKRKYTPDQMRELGKLAMNKELLSKSEQRRQLTALEKMAREVGTALKTK